MMQFLDCVYRWHHFPVVTILKVIVEMPLTILQLTYYVSFQTISVCHHFIINKEAVVWNLFTGQWIVDFEGNERPGNHLLNFYSTYYRGSYIYRFKHTATLSMVSNGMDDWLPGNIMCCWYLPRKLLLSAYRHLGPVFLKPSDCWMLKQKGFYKRSGNGWGARFAVVLALMFKYFFGFPQYQSSVYHCTAHSCTRTQICHKSLSYCTSYSQTTKKM